MTHRTRILLLGLGRNLLAFIAFWLVAFVLMQAGQRVSLQWWSLQMIEVAAAMVGVAIALRIRARIAMYVLAGQLAFVAAELVIHSIYGIQKAQGGPTHFAVMLAGTLGVALGALLTLTRGSSLNLSQQPADSAV